MSFLFTEVVEDSFLGCGGGVVGPLDRFRVFIDIFHVIGEDHELSGIDEAPEFGILETAIDAFSLGKDSVAIVGLFDLNEDKGQAIDEKSDVGSKLFFSVFAGQLSDCVEGVVGKVVEVEELEGGGVEEALVEGFAEVVVVEKEEEKEEISPITIFFFFFFLFFFRRRLLPRKVG